MRGSPRDTLEAKSTNLPLQTKADESLQRGELPSSACRACAVRGGTQLPSCLTDVRAQEVAGQEDTNVASYGHSLFAKCKATKSH